MKNLIMSAAIAGLATCFLALPAHAQATRTWVSGVGADDNPCSRTAPCKTYAGAISKTAKDGEISTLDPGGFGGVTITKSLTINGTPGSGYGSILATLINGVTVNITDAADVRKTVRLNWLDINGASTGLNGVRILSTNLAGTVVVVENTAIDGFTGRGISDERINGGELMVSNTSIRNTAGNGLTVAPASGSAQIRATLDNVTVTNTNNGISAGRAVSMFINRSVISGATAVGVVVDGTGTASQILMNNSVSANNGTGLQAVTNGTLRISNSDISLNGTGLAVAGGSIISSGNNRIAANGAAGPAPTPAGAASTDLGQQ